MKRETEVSRGEDARRLVEHPLYVEAIDKVRAGIVSAMHAAPLGDEKTHNRLVISLQLLSQIEKQLKDMILTGRMAEMQLHDTLTTRLRAVAGI